MDGKELQGHSFHKLLLLLLSVVAAVPGDSSVPVSGFLGEQVVLPCTYNGNVPVSDLLVIWCISKHEFLYLFVDGNNDLTEQDPRFRNRTKLFRDQLEQGNWSVLLSDLRVSDQNEYQCEILERKGGIFQQNVHLSVTAFNEVASTASLGREFHRFTHNTKDMMFSLERPPIPGSNTPVPGPGLPDRARVGLGIGILVVAGIGVYSIQKQKGWIRPFLVRYEASNGVPLTEVTCSGEARGLVTIAPEHQDGAAGEQNLLGDGTVQH